MIAELAVAAWLAASAHAQDEPTGPTAITETDNPEKELARRAGQALGEDEGMRRALARRLLDSSLADQLSGGETDPRKAVDVVAQWIADHPEDAGNLAVGFARDEENGNHEFENSLHERVVRFLKLNPDRYHGILGVLSAAGKESKVIQKLGKKMDEEEQRELVKRLFEGQGGEQGRVLKQPDLGEGRTRPSGGNAPAVTASSAYDRLSELNPQGYSPNVLSLQSALNAQRPPGAPKLIETGRLDFQTLAHPLYALRSDLGRQQASLAARRAWAIARALGREREFTAEHYGDPKVQAALEKEAAKAKLHPRLRKRRASLERARTAIGDFQAEAERMREPSSITRAGLKTLSLRQKEASRWLLAASLEGDMERLEGEAAFWTPELEALVQSLPAPEAARNGFLKQARAVGQRLSDIRRHDEIALAYLEGPEYLAKWPAMESELAEGNTLRQGLSRDIGLVVRVPGGFASAAAPLPGWKVFLQRWARRLAPSSPFARDAQSRERRISGWTEAFGLVAAGDFVRAQRAAEEASH